MKKFIIYFLGFVFICFVLPVLLTSKNKETSSKVENEISNENEVQENLSNEKYQYKQYGTIKLLHNDTGVVEDVFIDDYLCNVVSAEMPANYEIEALKAQAIVARTYTIYKVKNKKHENADICDDSNCCQAWISKEDRLARWEESLRESNWKKIEEAVYSTKGKIITYQNEPINAFFHSNSGGKTEVPVNVWGGTGYPYLQTVETAGEDSYSQYSSEVILSQQELIEKLKTKYADIQTKQADFSVTYVKNDFEKNDIRPEMYFKCIAYDSVNNKTTDYADPSNQEIEYEINYSQNIIVNTQAKDAISTDIYRMVDYIAKTVKYVDEVETKIDEVDKMISNTTDKDKLATLNSLKTSLETERDLRSKVMTDAFGMGLTMIDEAGQKVSVATSELGAKYNRAQLTYNKLLDEQTDSEDKLSENEDVSLTDVYINLTQADNLYQASLSATAKILGNSLLNYI